jgi:hypothetical protein
MFRREKQEHPVHYCKDFSLYSEDESEGSGIAELKSTCTRIYQGCSIKLMASVKK